MIVKPIAIALSLSAMSLPALAAPRGEPVTGTLPLGDKPGNPTYEMPANQRLISPFGERPVFSPDGRKIAFIGRSYGDAFEYDFATGRVRNLTGHMPHQGFLRVHYLHDGSFILAGPHVPAATREDTRLKTIELFWLDAAATRPPVPLKMTIFEGVATSRSSNRIAWTEVRPRGATWATADSTVLFTGRVAVSDGSATMSDVQEVTTTTDCLVEAQDFLPGEKGLTMPCYRFGSKAGGPVTEVVSVDFATKKITRYPTPPNLYGEVEGIFPDGRRTLVECSGDRAAGMDLCVLDLKPANPAYTRLTHIMDYGRWKYGNPVVSPDGRTIAAQVGSADVVDAGVGQGIVLIDVPEDF
ncbi:PD40 domain-containing protein [Sphingomonas profundi]|uniref:PD40 domain-containing protein n=1 Tax=Alterirhizorhabdus profundi TaxID=2681549 RepID=UPI0018CFF1D6|nr:PD40 domain-containing protein [Sphingomonas profundi]